MRGMQPTSTARWADKVSTPVSRMPTICSGNWQWPTAQAPTRRNCLTATRRKRRHTARSMVTGVARVTAALTTRRSVIRRVLGRVAPWILSRPAVLAKLGRTAGMLELAYSNGSLATAAGAGGRLANPELRAGGRLYDKLSQADWSWVVWGRSGQTSPDPDAECWRGIPVVFLPDRTQPQTAGQIPDSTRVMLIRPDRYVAGAGPTPESIRSVHTADD